LDFSARRHGEEPTGPAEGRPEDSQAGWNSSAWAAASISARAAQPRC